MAANMLIAIAGIGWLFHTAGGSAFADLIIDGHRETWPIRSKQFRSWLRRQHYAKNGEALGAAAIRSIVDLLEARAQFDAPERTVYLRVAQHEDRLYLDLADDRWQAVEVSPSGWRIVSRPPVRFRRPGGMLALPRPESGGSVETLAAFLNVSSRDDHILVVSWLLAALYHRGPYPVLAIAGEQGSAKTVLCKILRALVDPNLAPVRALPREERELMIAANNGHVLAFDNLSSLPGWTSDALCRLASGGSFAVRQLYTDADEVLFQAARPTILDGIEDVISRQDLADRAIFLTMQPVSGDHRRAESELWHEFEVARPRILGALLDALAHGLRTRHRLRLDRLPRMADFALWATACETACWSSGTFLKAYNENRRRAIEDTLEADPIAACVRTIMANQARWSGTASDLLRAAIGDDQLRGNGKNWPKNPRALAGRLRRSQPFLRALGIELGFTREGREGKRVIKITSRGDSSSAAPSAPSAASATTGRLAQLSTVRR